MACAYFPRKDSSDLFYHHHHMRSPSSLNTQCIRYYVIFNLYHINDLKNLIVHVFLKNYILAILQHFCGLPIPAHYLPIFLLEDLFKKKI